MVKSYNKLFIYYFICLLFLINNNILSNLNRDLTNTQVITKYKILSSLNSELNIDNRVFTKRGRKEIKSELINSKDNAKFYLDYTLGATVRALNPFRISYYGDRAFSEEEQKIKDGTKLSEIVTHQQSAEAYGNYVNSALVGSIIRTAGETGQFFMYTAQDIYSRIKDDKPGPYQPYKWSSENGGLIDSYYDVMNVVNGAQGKYEFQPNQSIVNKYNNEDYNKYINNGRKW